MSILATPPERSGPDREGRLTPLVLTAPLVRLLPLELWQPLFDRLLAAVLRRHPHVLQRLDGFEGAVVGIDPVDLPLAFLVRLDPRRPSIRAVRGVEAPPASAVVRGPLAALLDLMQGWVDGDALFFERGLTIEGDTGLIVALRNALDGAEIDIAAALPGPLGALYERAEADLAGLQRAVLAPATAALRAHEARLGRLEAAPRERHGRAPRRAGMGEASP